jgi:heme exporter protein C
MGLIYRIFYFHVASAWSGMDAFFVCFVCNLLYVWKRAPKYDWLAVSAAEVGLVLTTVVLITGPIWAHPVWGIWWTWDARLTSTFVLWLLYVSYLLLRTLIEEPDRRALLSSLFGIFAFLDVPLVFGAIRWWRTQHPQPVIMGGPGSGLDPTMKKVLFFFVFGMHVFAAFLIVERYILERMKNEVDILQRESEAL